MVEHIMKKSRENIKVCIRMRPLLRPYEDEVVWEINGSRKSISSIPSSFLSIPPLDISAISLSSLKERELRRRYTDISGPQTFTFDHIYAPEDTSLTIYEEICRPIVESTIKGYNAALLMYGQTTSGKTYTMLGTPELPGLLPCAMRHIFHLVHSAEYNVYVSYLEIYNEQINDLLNPGATNLKVKEDKVDGAQIEHLSSHQVWSFDQVIMIMNFGEEKRSYRETSLNEHSSRSHTIFRVCVESKEVGAPRTFGCLNLVDLAGSERLNESETKAPEVLGETRHINKSLFILANVVNRLATGKLQHIPYRDSKLTRILSQALGGNSLAGIICTISPAAINFHQTLSTLRFANRAKTVQNDPKVNEVVNNADLLSQYKLEILRLKTDLEKAQSAFVRIDHKNRELVNQLESVILEANSPRMADGKYKELLEKLHEENKIRDALEKELENQRNLFQSAKEEHQKTQQKLESLELTARKNPVSHISTETNYIENMIISINQELGDDICNDPEWKDTCHSTKEKYAEDLSALQDKYTEFLSLGLKKIAMKETLEPIEEIPQEDVFADINPRFADIFQEFVASGRSELSEVMVNKLKNQHEYFIGKVQSRYEQAGQALEEYFASQPTQINYHLESLRNNYEDTMRNLETSFIETLSMFDAFLASPSSGSAFMWGSGKDGRLGNESESSSATPICVIDSNVSQILCGYHHSATLTSEGKLLTWGRGLFGQLGHNSSESLGKPSLVKPLSAFTVIQVACGWQHTIALTSSKRVYTWGYGEDGQLGHGDFKDYLSPKEIVQLASQDTSMIACGHSHSGCIAGGDLYTWGCNPDARCFKITPDNIPEPCKIELNGKPTHLSLGVNHSGVVIDNGKVCMAGTGQDGQLGIESSSFLEKHELKFRNASSVACGDSFTVLLNSHGKVFTFGKSAHGRLGVGTDVPEIVHTPTELSLDNIKSISAGCRHAGAINANGELFVWGFNFYQQLGLGNDKDCYAPVKSLSKVLNVSCGYFHSGAITE